MEATDLKPDTFSRYAPGARAFALAHLRLLQQIPLSLLPMLLIRIQQYEISFPAQKLELGSEAAVLSAMAPSDLAALMRPFASIELSAELKKMDWVNHPRQFSERLTAWLWSSTQINSYHAAAEAHQQHMLAIIPQVQSPGPRCTFVVLGRGASQPSFPLFRKLAPYGTTFSDVDPTDGMQIILSQVMTRAKQYPMDYGHWYIDGAEALSAPGLTTLSYNRLVPAARREFALIQRFSSGERTHGTAAVEAVSSYVAGLTPEDLHLAGNADDAPLRNFAVNVLTQGAGAQIFSTTFVQWASRECLHRAQPLTLLARFGSRQKMAPMEKLLSQDPLSQPQDEEGSLIDADMGAYYTWINQSRLPNSDQARFIAWWEGHNTAVAISPSLPRGTRSPGRTDIKQILAWTL